MSETLLPPIAGIRPGKPGFVDQQLSTLADRLELSGVLLAGAVQQDVERPERCRCDMLLRVLGTELNYPISTDLGPMSQGCRLDTGALEQAAWQLEAVLRSTSRQVQPSLLIINKFSKSEAHGKGFLPVILLALELGIPVLCGIGRLSLDEFIAFTDGHANLLEPDTSAINQWVTSCLPTSTAQRIEKPRFSSVNSSRIPIAV